MLTRLPVAVFFALAAMPALADIIVDTAADEDTANTACSLREAIIAVNTQADYNGCVDGNATKTWSKITFAIPPNAGEVQTITLGSVLPFIDMPVFIDATTQSGSVCTPVPDPRVYVSGNSNYGGLSYSTNAVGSKLHGLGFSHVGGTALGVGGDNFTVGCVTAGLDASATTTDPAVSGIAVFGKNATIGEASASAWFPNVIAVNGTNIRLFAGADNAVISGNYIGVDTTGLTPLVGNWGIYVAAAGARIGTGFGDGPPAHQRNVIGVQSGGASSVDVYLAGASDTIIAGNYIGVGVDGKTELPIVAGGAINVIGSANTLVGCNGIGSWDDCRNVIVDPDYPALSISTDSTGTSVVSNFVNIAADGITLYPATFNGGAGIVLNSNALVARNVVGTADFHSASSLNAPNVSTPNAVFLNATSTFAGGATLDSSDNCFPNTNAYGVNVSTPPGGTKTTATFLNNWWGAANGPRPNGSGAIADAVVTATPYLIAPSVYCGFDRIFSDGFN